MKNILTLLVLVLIFSDSCFAQPIKLSYPEVLNLALENSPLVKQINSQTQNFKADALELSTWQNPELSAEVRPYVSGGKEKDQEYEIGLALPLRLSDFGTRNKVASLISQTADIDKKTALLSLSQDIRLAYARSWLLQDGLSRSSTVLKRIEAIRKSTGDKTASGLFPRSILSLLDAQISKIKAERIGMQAAALRADSELIRKTGLSTQSLKLAPLDISEVKVEIDSEYSSSVPAAARIKLLRSLTDSQRRLTRLDSYSRFTPKVAFEHTDDGDDRIVAGLSFELPLFDRNQAGRLRQEAEHSLAISQETFQSGPAFVEAANSLKQSANSSLKSLELFRSGVIPQLLLSLSEIEREISAGQASPLQLVQTLGELFSAEDRYLELWEQSLLQRAELTALLGEEV